MSNHFLFHDTHHNDWLFLYPKEGFARINQKDIVLIRNFQLTSDIITSVGYDLDDFHLNYTTPPSHFLSKNDTIDFLGEIEEYFDVKNLDKLKASILVQIPKNFGLLPSVRVYEEIKNKEKFDLFFEVSKQIESYKQKRSKYIV